MTLFSCKEPYHPTVVAQHHLLVVEGYINVGGEPTIISITRTRNLSDTGAIISGNGITDTLFVVNAEVNVEDDAGNNYTLYELGKGRYGGIVKSADPQRKYRLHIHTANNEEYASAFVPVLSSPTIDSVYWRLEGDGAHLYMDVHNDNAGSPYYRWTFADTWEFHTWYHSEFTYSETDTTFIPRDAEEFLDTCWQNTVSNNILLSNTTGLSDNRLAGTLLQVIPDHSEALSVLFSMNVKVYAISREEYEFWQLMKKNTEELGSIFGPQPSAIGGNIKCLTQPGEPVIGYIAAGIPATKRVWINNKQLPASWNGDGNFYDCELKKLKNDDDGRDTLARDLKGSNPEYIPVSVEKDLQGNIQYYNIARRRCADCTQRGVRKKPYFWP